MTMPIERSWAIRNTREFLRNLLDPKKTPRVPRSIREQAYRCLRHYPWDLYIQDAAKVAPNAFGLIEDESEKRPEKYK